MTPFLLERGGVLYFYRALERGLRMKCPHCLDSYHGSKSAYGLGKDAEFDWHIYWESCPSCGKYIITLEKKSTAGGVILRDSILAYPKSIARASVSKDVPDEFAQDYKEACLVISDSPKASAALSRRCLQNLLRDKAGVKTSNLNKEIGDVLASKQLPSYLAEGIDAVRNIGNFAAHPIKSTSTGEIVAVEPGEAEWLLDLLEGLFDFYFAQPAELKRKKEALNKKLADAGKPSMK